MQSAHQFEHAAGGMHSGGIGNRMRRFDDLDALAGHRIAIARDHQARQRTGPILLDGASHGGRRLARSDDDEPAARRRGKMRRNAQRRLRRRDRGIKHLPQQQRSGEGRCRFAHGVLVHQHVCQHADSRNFHLDGAAVLDRTDPHRRAARDHIAGQQRHIVGDSAHQFLRRDNHIRERIVLTLHSIETGDQPCLRPIQSVAMTGPRQPKVSMALRAAPLRKIGVLVQFAGGGHIVDAGVAEDVIARLVRAQRPCSVCRSRFPVHLHRRFFRRSRAACGSARPGRRPRSRA